MRSLWDPRRTAGAALILSLLCVPLCGEAAFTPTAPLPDLVYGHALVNTNGYLYNIGGLSGTVGWQGGLHVYVAAVQPGGGAGAWSATTPLPQATFFHSAVAVNGVVYVFGGWHYVNGLAPSAAVYWSRANPDGTLGAWQSGPDLPQTLFFLSAAAWNGRIYVTGGWNPSNGTLSGQVYSAAIQQDGSLGAWRVETALPEAVYTHAAVSDGTLYVLGGVANGGNEIENIVYYSRINADGSLSAWSTTTPMPQALANHAAAVADGYVIVSGGWTGASASGAAVQAPVNPDGTLGSWTGFASLPDPIYLHAETAAGGWLYISGGNDGEHSQSAVYSAPLPAASSPLLTSLAVGQPQFGASPLFVSTNTAFSLSVAGGSGEDTTLYALDSGTWTAYAAPIRVPNDGFHWLRYLSYDGAGEREAPHSASFAVDGTPPQTSLATPVFAASDGGAPYVSASAPIALSAQDPVVASVASGVAGTDFSVDAGSASAYSGSFGLPEGTHIVTARSVDNVGNGEAWRPFPLRVDGTAPQTTAALSQGVTLFGADLAAPGTTLALSAQDPVSNGVASGLAEILVSLDSAPLQAYTAPLALSEGAHEAVFHAVDNVGNAEDARQLSVAATRWLSDALSATGSITLSGRAEVAGDVSAPSVTLEGGAEVNGAVDRSAPAQALDVAQAASAAQAQNNDAAISGWLANGALSLSGRQSLVLPDGEYYLTGLSLSGAASLSISTRADVFVHGEISVSGQAALNAGGDAAGLWIVSDGTGVSVTGRSRSAFNLYAPSADVALSGGGQFAGRIFAGNISLSGGAAQPSTTALPAPEHRGRPKSVEVAEYRAGGGTETTESAPAAPPEPDSPVPQSPIATASGAASVQRVAFNWPGVSVSSHAALGVVAGQGGAVASPDGSGVTIPQGAASSGLDVTVAQAPAPDPVEQHRRDQAAAQRQLVAAALPVQFGPEGTQFAKPVTLALPYDPASLPAGASAEDLAVYYWNPGLGDWQPMPSLVDARASVVRAQTTHFSLYQVMVGPKPQSAVAQASNDVSAAQIACNPLRPGCETMKFQNLPAGARLRIYTLTGALVKDISALGNGTAQWDGTNRSGEPAGSGVYFILAQGGGTTKVLKVAVER